jgi:pimeloyl-ACP methyl ester carboxylesterase
MTGLSLPADARVPDVRSADGTRLHVEVYGPPGAATIVLAHGITNSIRAWGYQIRSLSQRFQVVAYDQRGHGGSDRSRLPGQYTVDALGDDLHAVLDGCTEPGRPAVLAGHSMGGISIMSWAARYPADVEARAAACLLLTTSAGGLAEHFGGLRLPRGLQVVGRALLSRRVPPGLHRTAAGRRAVRWLAFGPTATVEQLTLLDELIYDCPQHTRAHLVRHLSRMTLYDGIARLTVPTLVIAGELDRLLPPVHSMRIADRLPALDDLVILPGIGHMAQLEARAEITARLADLVERFVPDTAASPSAASRRQAGQR